MQKLKDLKLMRTFLLTFISILKNLFKIIAHSLFNKHLLVKISPMREKIGSGQVLNTKVCYNLDIRPRNLIQGHYTTLLQDSLLTKPKKAWDRGKKKLVQQEFTPNLNVNAEQSMKCFGTKHFY